MKFKTHYLLPLLVIAGGCAGGAQESAKAASPSPSESMAEQLPSDTYPGRRAEGADIAQLVSKNDAAMPRNVVKSGSMTVQVDNVDASERKAREIAEALGGRVDRVTSSNLASPDASMSLTLRVPVKSFESTMERLQALGTRIAKQVQVDDVTDQLIDFNARLKTMRVQEELVRNMLRKAGNLQDSLTINNDLSRLRAEIESLDAKRQSLASQASFSTLELTLVQKTTAVAVASTDPNWFQSSWADAWGAGTLAFRAIVGWLMWLVVFSPVWILILVVIRRGLLISQTNQPSQGATQ